MREVFRFRKKV